MLTASYLGNRQIGIRNLEAASPKPGQVQIEVAYTGICGTDLHVLHGSMDDRVTIPAVLGHEMSGVIAAVGEGVTGWKPGDHVTVMPLEWDDTCPGCRAGNQHICQHLNFIGIDSPGAMQRLWNVRADHLVALPPALRLDHAALVEPTAVAVHDVRRSGLAAGQHAFVIGGGPIGILIAAVARHTGAEVVVAEIDPQRRKMVESLGFQVLDPASTDQFSWVQQWTNDAGADVVFEVSGAAPALLGAADLLKVRGSLVIVAIYATPQPVNLHRVWLRELQILGARVYQRTDFERAVELVSSGVIPADRIISRVSPIGETADAFALLESGQAMKVLVDLESTGAAS